MDVLDIFYFLLLGGGERGAQGAGRGRGDDFSWKIPGGGGSPRRVGAGGARGQEGVEGNLGGIWGGGLNISFRGRNSHQDCFSCPYLVELGL